MKRLGHDARVLSVVLAGGMGKRLMPLTAVRAKPAVIHGGQYRLIDFALSNLVNGGFRRIVVLTQYKSLSLERHIRQGWHIFNEALGEFIVPIPPQQRLGGSWYQGTADAIFQNIYTLEQERPRFVLILSGDHVYRMDYGRMIAEHITNRADVTITGPAEDLYLYLWGRRAPALTITGDADAAVAWSSVAP